MSFDQEKGTFTIRNHVFQFKSVVTAKQFAPIKALREKHDSIERSDEIKNITEKQGNEMEKEWFESIILTGLENETLDSVEEKLSPGEIRALVAATYNFLWTFGSISEAQRSSTILKAIQSNGAKSSKSTQT